MHRRNILASDAGRRRRRDRGGAGEGGPRAALMPRRPSRRWSITCRIWTKSILSSAISAIISTGMGGPDHVTISLVVHGPALKAFQTAVGLGPICSHRVGEFAKTGLELNACGNTMKAQKITLKDLLPGFIIGRQRRCGPAGRTAIAGLRLSAALMSRQLRWNGRRGLLFASGVGLLRHAALPARPSRTNAGQRRASDITGVNDDRHSRLCCADQRN